MNDEAEAGAAFDNGGKYTLPFQRQYAATLAGLAEVNAEIQVHLGKVRAGAGLGQGLLATAAAPLPLPSAAAPGASPGRVIVGGIGGVTVRRLGLSGGKWDGTGTQPSASTAPGGSYPGANSSAQPPLHHASAFDEGPCGALVLSVAGALGQALVDDTVAGAADLGPGALGPGRAEVEALLGLVQKCCGALIAVQVWRMGGGENRSIFTWGVFPPLRVVLGPCSLYSLFLSRHLFLPPPALCRWRGHPLLVLRLAASQRRGRQRLLTLPGGGVRGD